MYKSSALGQYIQPCRRKTTVLKGFVRKENKIYYHRPFSHTWHTTEVCNALWGSRLVFFSFAHVTFFVHIDRIKLVLHFELSDDNLDVYILTITRGICLSYHGKKKTRIQCLLWQGVEDQIIF